ncbi:hypothetical protein PMAYCL1PPCAC_29148, partial [Pristionchus mayeri]
AIPPPSSSESPLLISTESSISVIPSSSSPSITFSTESTITIASSSESTITIASSSESPSSSSTISESFPISSISSSASTFSSESALSLSSWPSTESIFPIASESSISSIPSPSYSSSSSPTFSSESSITISTSSSVATSEVSLSQLSVLPSIFESFTTEGSSISMRSIATSLNSIIVVVSTASHSRIHCNIIIPLLVGYSRSSIVSSSARGTTSIKHPLKTQQNSDTVALFAIVHIHNNYTPPPVHILLITPTS